MKVCLIITKAFLFKDTIKCVLKSLHELVGLRNSHSRSLSLSPSRNRTKKSVWNEYKCYNVNTLLVTNLYISLLAPILLSRQIFTTLLTFFFFFHPQYKLQNVDTINKGAQDRFVSSNLIS